MSGKKKVFSGFFFQYLRLDELEVWKSTFRWVFKFKLYNNLKNCDVPFFYVEPRLSEIEMCCQVVN